MNRRKNLFIMILLAIVMWASTIKLYAWEGMAMPRLHVDGKHLKDENGNIVKCGTGAELLSDDAIIKAYLGG